MDTNQCFIAITRCQFNRLSKQGLTRMDPDGRLLAKINPNFDYVPVRIEGEPVPEMPEIGMGTGQRFRESAKAIHEALHKRS